LAFLRLKSAPLLDLFFARRFTFPIPQTVALWSQQILRFTTDGEGDLLTVHASEKALLSGDAVQGVVCFTEGTKVAAEYNRLVDASRMTGIINGGNPKLNRSVVLRRDQAARRTAFPWNQPVHGFALLVLHEGKEGHNRPNRLCPSIRL
jgi:hypothetical protein